MLQKMKRDIRLRIFLPLPLTEFLRNLLTSSVSLPLSERNNIFGVVVSVIVDGGFEGGGVDVVNLVNEGTFCEFFMSWERHILSDSR